MKTIIMKPILLVIFAVILVSCGKETSTTNDSLIGIEFQQFKEVNQLSHYIKISDTTIYGDSFDSQFGILHLRDDANSLILFNKISRDSFGNGRHHKIVDTLVIPSVTQETFITIGYCEIDGNEDENIIALVDKADNLMIQHIQKAWQANTISEKIEPLKDLKGITCFNALFFD